MNWEDSKASTPLKRDFLRAWFAEDQRFFLTGGSALGIFYLQHRLSYDLDLFTTQEVDAKTLQSQVFRMADSIGAKAASQVSTPDFHRLSLTRGEDVELLDFVVDRAPQLDVTKQELGGVKVDTLREIIANKLTALIGRTELRDVVDLYFLEQDGHNLLQAIPDAQAKDGGWEPSVVSMLLQEVRVNKVPPLMLRSVTREELRGFVDRLRLAIGARAIPPK